MVDITIDNYGIHGVYKPTYNLWFMIDITYIWYNELVFMGIIHGL